MNLLFVHGTKFRRIDGAIYSLGGLQQDVLIRYVNWFGHVNVVGRLIEEQKEGKSYKKIDHPDIRFFDKTDLEEQVKKADALVVRLPSRNGYRAIALAKKYKRKCLVEVVACVWDAYWNYGIKGKLAAWPAMRIMKRCVKNASHVVYVSQIFLQKRYPTGGHSMSISDVELMPADSGTLEKRLKRIEEETPRKLIIGTVAAIDVPHKGQEYVIKALPLIKERSGLEIEYQLVGGGDSQRLAGIAKECNVESNVKFLGFMNHDEVFAWLDGIDLYIQSSFQEGLCRALVEAMSRGLPCAASDVGGNPELIDKKYIFSMKGRSLIARNICSAVCELSKYENMRREAERNYYYACSEFEKDLLSKKRDDFYLTFKKEVEKNA